MDQDEFACCHPTSDFLRFVGTSACSVLIICPVMTAPCVRESFIRYELMR